MIRVTDNLSINPSLIADIELDNRHYMNGSDCFLVITMDDGRRHRIQHGWGTDIFEIKRRLEGS
jgi:hypothetical protein